MYEHVYLCETLSKYDRTLHTNAFTVMHFDYASYTIRRLTANQTVMYFFSEDQDNFLCLTS